MSFEPLRAPALPTSTSAVCIGSGRFVRAVLVPVLLAVGSSVVIAQPRGKSFIDACVRANGAYSVDVVQPDGSEQTEVYHVDAVGSLGDAASRDAFIALPTKLKGLKYVGFAVTDAGVAHESQAIKDLAAFLFACFQALPDNALSVINTDNVPTNGDTIERFVRAATWSNKPNDVSAFERYLTDKITFHNTMVDRLTTHRVNDVIVPRTEPLPHKALVIEDLHNVLDAAGWSTQPGVILRTTPGQLARDHVLKLSVANAVHTALVYPMALLRLRQTSECTHEPLLREYVAALFARDLLPSLVARGIAVDDAQRTFDEWIARVMHGGVSLDTFWIAQNALSKYNNRLFASVQAALEADRTYRPSVFMAFATAALLRFLTPLEVTSRRAPLANQEPVFVGGMDPIQHHKQPIYAAATNDNRTWTYANDLTANTSTGKYEFVDNVNGRVAFMLQRASHQALTASQSSAPFAFPKAKATAEASAEVATGVGVAIATVLSSVVDGFDLTNDVHASFAVDVAALYQRLVSGKATCDSTTSTSGTIRDVLADVLRNQQVSEFLQTRDALATFVREAVASVQVIDVHTHLFPPSHGALMLWGINELLTYHYLVAEYMMTAPMEIEAFNSLSKPTQAALIWQHLFVDRSPLSEACRGVITTLQALGLEDLLARRDLPAIQRWFAAQDPSEYVDTVFRLAGLQYVVMTNIPFEPEEARHWLGDATTGAPPPTWSRAFFRSALRVDQILLGDWQSIAPTLDQFELPHTLAGCRTLLEKWLAIMEPEYFMASVPIEFEYPLDDAPTTPRDALPTGADLLLQVLLPLAEARALPIALKFDSVRPINARLGVAGDGVKPSNVDILIKLCSRFPRVKFLATFLSRVNQHEVTVAANKFRNLHLYGCWWYCNNPSIIEEMTRMRIEILGTGFTSQHSDARVLDQLIYKWRHSREIIGDVLVDMYTKMFATGWKIAKSDVTRDVQRLFGQSYEEFMRK